MNNLVSPFFYFCEKGGKKYMAQKRIESILKEIHDEGLNTIPLLDAKKRERDMKDAAQIQLILQNIKKIKFNQASNIGDFINLAMMQNLVDDATNMLNDARRNKAGLGALSTQGLFYRAHGIDVSSKKADDIFEEEFAALLASIEKQATGKVINYENKLIGSEKANIQLETIVDDQIQNIMNKMIKKCKDETKQSLQRHWTSPQARAQKIDIKGTSILEASAQINQDWETLYKLFEGKTFSLKNYSSYNKMYLNIHLGHSDYYKALYGALTNIKYNGQAIDQKSAERIILAGLKSIQKHNNLTVSTHFYHLRFIYELTGIGLYDEKGDPISGVDYIIYNDPNSSNIYVKSTAELIYNEIQRKKIPNGLSSITIPKASFT